MGNGTKKKVKDIIQELEIKILKLSFYRIKLVTNV